MLRLALITSDPVVTEIITPLIKALEADVVLTDQITDLHLLKIDAILWHPPATTNDSLASQLLAFNVPIVILVSEDQRPRLGAPRPNPDPAQAPFSYFLTFPFDSEEIAVVIRNLVDLNRKH